MGTKLTQGQWAALNLALVIPQIIINGLVFRQLWTWFIVPPFDLPALGLAQAIGVMAVLRFLTPNIATAEEKQTFSTLIMWLLGPFVALFAGWIVTFFL